MASLSYQHLISTAQLYTQSYLWWSTTRPRSWTFIRRSTEFIRSWSVYRLFVHPQGHPHPILSSRTLDSWYLVRARGLASKAYNDVQIRSMPIWPPHFFIWRASYGRSGKLNLLRRDVPLRRDDSHLFALSVPFGKHGVKVNSQLPRRTWTFPPSSLARRALKAGRLPPAHSPVTSSNVSFMRRVG